MLFYIKIDLFNLRNFYQNFYVFIRSNGLILFTFNKFLENIENISFDQNPEIS